MPLPRPLRRVIEVAAFAFDPHQDIELFGMYGLENIGDEAMRDAGLAILPAGRAAAVVPTSGIGILRRAQQRRVRPFLAMGGGTLIHGGAENGHNPWLDHVETRLAAGARLSTFGSGVAFTEDQLAAGAGDAARWATLLGRADHLGVRGPRSVAALARLGLSATVFGDAVFALHDPALAAARQPEGSGKDRVFGLNLGRCHQDQDRYDASFARIAAEIGREFRIRVFVARPHDAPIAARIMAASGLPADRVEYVHTYIDSRLYMRQVVGCSGFAGIKMHTAGLAMIAGVPALLCAYRDKCRDFAAPIGLEHALFDLPVDEAVALALVEDMLSRPADYTAVPKIAEFADSQRAAAAKVYGG